LGSPVSTLADLQMRRSGHEEGSLLDVIIVGGGPAGLNAALILGRCRRRVLVCDAKQPRNARSRGVSGFLTRDGTSPWAIRGHAVEEIAKYPSVAIRDMEVVRAEKVGSDFEVTFENGERHRARKLLLATGWMDDAPEFPGAVEFYGHGVYPCPYCDGWEHRDERLAVYGRECDGPGLALELTVWSSDVVLLTDGPAELSEHDRDRLSRHGIEIIEDPLARLEGEPNGRGVERIHFETGRMLETRAIFFSFRGGRQSPLIEAFGLEFSRNGLVETGRCEQTNVPGLFVAGDAAHSVQFAIVAAGEGASAAFAINTELLKDDLAHHAAPVEREPQDA
jgi:thioredoxin reductase